MIRGTPALYHSYIGYNSSLSGKSRYLTIVSTSNYRYTTFTPNKYSSITRPQSKSGISKQNKLNIIQYTGN
jgi:hypothetical protein